MAQLNIYVPMALAKALKTAAKKQHKNLSAFVTDVLSKEVSPTEWPQDFFTKVVGQWHGEFPEIESLPFEKRETF